jgi:hypothetical protein
MGVIIGKNNQKVKRKYSRLKALGTFLYLHDSETKGPGSWLQENILRINETKSWFFENVNKIVRPLVKLTKERGKRPRLI